MASHKWSLLTCLWNWFDVYDLAGRKFIAGVLIMVMTCIGGTGILLASLSLSWWQCTGVALLMVSLILLGGTVLYLLNKTRANVVHLKRSTRELPEKFAAEMVQAVTEVNAMLSQENLRRAQARAVERELVVASNTAFWANHPLGCLWR